MSGDSKGPRLQITCECGWSGKVSGRWAGKKVQCKKCASPVRVPKVPVARPVTAFDEAPPIARLVRNAPRRSDPESHDDSYDDDEEPEGAFPGIQQALVLLRNKKVRAGFLAFGGTIALLMIVTTAYTRSNGYLFSVATDTGNRRQARQKAKRKLLEDASPDDLSELLAGLPGQRRGDFPQLIAASENPAYVADLVASLDKGNSDRKLEAIFSFGPEVTSEALFPAFLDAQGKLKAQILRTLVQVPPRRLRAQVLTISDPVMRGAFPEALATSGDPDQVDAIQAWLVESDTKGRWKRAKDAMLKLDRARARTAMVKAYELTQLEAIRQTVNATFSAKDLVSDVMKIEDETLRGGFPDALVHDGAPEHVTPILAFTGAHPEVDSGKFVSALIALGPRAVPHLTARLETESEGELKIAYGALAKLDPEAVSAHAAAVLRRYLERTRRSASRESTLSLGDSELDAMLARLRAQQRGNAEPEDPFRSVRESIGPLRPLKALRGLEGQRFDFCYLYGLTCNDRVVAEYCATALDERLDRDQLIDAIFGYIAHKESFAMDEVKLYERLLVKTGNEGTPQIVKNLERLLQKAGGKPEGVFFILKVLAFRALEAIGTGEAVPILKVYMADTDSYILETTTTSGMFGTTDKSQQEIHFAKVAEKAYLAIRNRPRAR